MTQPRRPPVKPKPIGTHPHAGQLAVVVSFRLDPHDRRLDGDIIAEHFRCLFGPALIRKAWMMADLTVHVREIGAGGEASEMEGEGP